MALVEIMNEMQELDASKMGVKGLVDSGLLKLPRIFHDEKRIRDTNPTTAVSAPPHNYSMPIVDFSGIEIPDRRQEIMEQVRDASETWGFLMIKNHGIPVEILDEIREGVRDFHEQDPEAKKPYYTRDKSKRFRFTTNNLGLIAGVAANWKDSIEVVLDPADNNGEEFPTVCRDILIRYSQHVMKLGHTMFELLSEGLGLESDHLKNMHVAERIVLLGHYGPPCPEPELTFATSSHTDSGFLTILLQDNTGGLQILYKDQWVDVPCVPGTLIINIADLLQLLTNDIYKSVYHRVKAKEVGPRISVACHFRTHFQEGVPPMHISPIKELLSDENPPHYREITVQEYIDMRFKIGLDGSSFLAPFKLNQEKTEN
jgi:isopenicillin N synthase-like dioxygenase